MRLLTLGIGIRGAKIVEMLSRKGPKVNKIPLFKPFVLLNDVDALKSIALPEDRKIFILNDSTGAIASATNLHEISEGNLIIISFEDEFAYKTALEVVGKLKEMTEEYTVVVGIVPKIVAPNIIEIKEKIRNIRELCDVLFLFSGTFQTDEFMFKSLSLLALAGEVDLKRREAGEVVIDTSDIFNSLKGEGFSVIGYAERNLPFYYFGRSRSELKALRTRRMLDLLNEAMKNLSIEAEISEAKSALILFASKAEEITMEGIFSAVSRIEKLNDNIVVRYGDCPMKTNKLHLILLFSGIKKLIL
ncbi:MAG: cell division protein [Archaeoglobaceae archaeon]|nr:cell division protein [Archaeoglobaceae archaeon]MCX8151811.1 cell division protein [Archaeoglobaceae archaeon]MDW8014357.1 cell division protein [Archaeoglobaceae archaeon]